MLFLSDTMSLTVMRPSFNGVNPSMALRRDVFPHPDEPEMLAISPLFNCRLKLENSTSLPYAILASSICSINKFFSR